MGKAGFWLRGAKGKLAGTTLYRGKAGTIQREVVAVSNPKTTGQMRQRALFAECVKFYKHAQHNLFKFAFEDKKQTESDYNAFVRHNVQNSIVLPYENVKNDRFPALGNSWQLTYGSLATPEVTIEGTYVKMTIQGLTGTETTWGEVSAKLISYYGVEAGDFMTLVTIESLISSLEAVPSKAPIWKITQWRIDPSSNIALESIGEAGTDALLFDTIGGIDYAAAAAVIFSRNIQGSGVKVSSSYLINNDMAYDLVNAALDENAIAAALNTWGATGKAILQGSLIEPGRAVEPSFVGFRGAGNNLIDAFSTTLTEPGELVNDRGILGEVNYVIIAGSHLEALDSAKFIATSGSTNLAVELHNDAVYGYYLTIDVEDSIESGIEVRYDGSLIFYIDA